MLGVPCLHCTAMVQPPDRSSVRVRPGRGPRTGGGQPDTTSCDTPTGRGTRAVLYRQVPAAGSIPHVPAQQLRPTGSQHQLPPRARGSAPTMHGLQFARPELAHSHSDQSDQDPTFCGAAAAARAGRAGQQPKTPRTPAYTCIVLWHCASCLAQRSPLCCCCHPLPQPYPPQRTHRT